MLTEAEAKFNFRRRLESRADVELEYCTGEGNTAKKPIKLPACSDWFKLEAVHEIEREAFARVFVTTDANDEDNGVVDSAAEEVQLHPAHTEETQ